MTLGCGSFFSEHTCSGEHDISEDGSSHSASFIFLSIQVGSLKIYYSNVKLFLDAAGETKPSILFVKYKILAFIIAENPPFFERQHFLIFSSLRMPICKGFKEAGFLKTASGKGFNRQRRKNPCLICLLGDNIKELLRPMNW